MAQAFGATNAYNIKWRTVPPGNTIAHAPMEKQWVVLKKGIGVDPKTRVRDHRVNVLCAVRQSGASCTCARHRHGIPDVSTKATASTIFLESYCGLPRVQNMIEKLSKELSKGKTLAAPNATERSRRGDWVGARNDNH